MKSPKSTVEKKKKWESLHTNLDIITKDELNYTKTRKIDKIGESTEKEKYK